MLGLTRGIAMQRDTSEFAFVAADCTAVLTFQSSGYVASTGKFLGGFPAGPQPSSLTSPTQGADVPGSGLPPITTPTDNESFLRGAWATDDNGHVTMYSIVSRNLF